MSVVRLVEEDDDGQNFSAGESRFGTRLARRMGACGIGKEEGGDVFADILDSRSRSQLGFA